MKRAVLFDLGNTLVSYYKMCDFHGILRQAIGQAARFLQKEELSEATWERASAENFESADYSVRSLEGRLTRIFELDPTGLTREQMIGLCRAFLMPIFVLAHVYDDAAPALVALREQGCRTAIISNTPWGSPGTLWREELVRLGLADKVDVTVFCTDCGWRKPARQVFDYALAKMDVTPEQCIFIGDDPRWDVAGPQLVGMEALLINRCSAMPASRTRTTLFDLPKWLDHE